MPRKTSSSTTIDPSLDAVALRLGERLRILRLTRRLSQGRVGAVIGVTAQQVHRYERGASAITATNLWRISQALGAPIGFFFDESTDNRLPLPRLDRASSP